MQQVERMRRKDWKLNTENYTGAVLAFQDRQAGVGVVYDPESEKFQYNAYCVETKLMKEIFTVEYHFLDEALETIHDEFGTWEILEFDSGGCSSCSAK